MKTYCNTNTCSPQYTTKTLLDSPKTTYYFHKKHAENLQPVFWPRYS